MTTINTTEDLLRIARNNEEFRVALRRELLTEELLATPAQVTHLLTTQTAILEDLRTLRQDFSVMRQDFGVMQQELASLRQDFSVMQQELASLRQDFSVMQQELASLRQDFGVMQQELASLRQDFGVMQQELASLRQDFGVMQQELVSLRQETNSLRQTQNTMLGTLSGIEARLDRQHEMYRRQHDDLARFRGNYAIDAARNRDGQVAELFARQRGMRRIQVRRLSRADLDDILNDNYEAVEALRLRERVWSTFPNADIIAEVTQRRHSGQGFYIAVEASYTANTEDVLRATDHAKILRSVTGLDAYAVVAGVRMAPSIEGTLFDDIAWFIESGNEDGALWVRLELDELEPLDPC